MRLDYMDGGGGLFIYFRLCALEGGRMIFPWRIRGFTNLGIRINGLGFGLMW